MHLSSPSPVLLPPPHPPTPLLPRTTVPSDGGRTYGYIRNVVPHAIARDSPKSEERACAKSGACRWWRPHGVAQLLSAVKPVNRGSQTPLRTAARSCTFDVSSPSLPPHMCLSQSLPRRGVTHPSRNLLHDVRSNCFLAIDPSRIDVERYTRYLI